MSPGADVVYIYIYIYNISPVADVARVWAGMDPAACARVRVCVSGATVLQSGVLSLRTRSRATSPRASSGGALGYSQRGTQGYSRGTQGVLSLRTRSRATSPRASSCRPTTRAAQAPSSLPSTHGVLSGYSAGVRSGDSTMGQPLHERRVLRADGRRGEPILGADVRKGEPILGADGRRGEPILCRCRWAQG